MTKEHYWNKAIEVTNRALELGSLVPLKTSLIYPFKNSYNDFQFRYLISKKPPHLNLEGPKINPFNPWDKYLEVDKILNKHILILNKYPVELGHMLLITKD